jgi:hypothetical protein
MKNSLKSAIFILLLYFSVSVFAGASQPSILADSRKAKLRYSMLYQQNDVSSLSSQQSPKIQGLKKPGLGLLFSATVPGTGEFYAGSWIKGAAFLGAEIALWIGYSKFTDKGNEWEAIFHDYANTHWSEPDYWVAMAQEAGMSGVTTSNYSDVLDELREYERLNYSHGLHVEKDQQYYEMIGKYHQFKWGWDDYKEGDNPLTPNRDYYEGLRDNSNQEFHKASTCAMVILGNHVLSALDAAWTIGRANKKIRGSAQMSIKKIDQNWTPFYGLQVQW